MSSPNSKKSGTSNTQLIKHAIKNELELYDSTAALSEPDLTPVVGSSKSGNLQLIHPDPNTNSGGSDGKNRLGDASKFTIERPKIVLDEDEYVANIERIIVRDYFPKADPYGVQSLVAPPQSLDQFQKKHTTEDNDSFNTILESEVQKNREKEPWFWKRSEKERISKEQQERKREIATGEAPKQIEYSVPSLKEKTIQQSTKLPSDALSLVTVKGSQVITSQANSLTQSQISHDNQVIARNLGWVDTRPKELDSWESNGNPRNSLMFFADKYGKGLTDQQLKNQAAKIIVKENTRFADQKEEDRDDDNRVNIINVDTRTGEHDGDAKPLINGYPFVTEDTYTPPEPPASSIDDTNTKQFTMQGPSSKELLRDRLIQRKLKSRQQLLGIRTSASSTPITTAFSSPAGSRSASGTSTPAYYNVKGKVGKEYTKPPNNLSPAASTILASIQGKQQNRSLSFTVNSSSKTSNSGIKKKIN